MVYKFYGIEILSTSIVILIYTCVFPIDDHWCLEIQLASSSVYGKNLGNHQPYL